MESPVLQRKKFIENELFAFCKIAAFGRVLHFNKEAVKDDPVEKEHFYRDLRRVFDDFRDSPRLEDHFSAIAGLQKQFERAAEKYSHIFKTNDRPFITIGMTQKFLNLYLKYRWCLGDPEPPHCPIDSQVLRYMKKDWRGQPYWSKFDLSDYREAVQSLKDAIEKLEDNSMASSIALWELDFFNHQNPSYLYSEDHSP